MRLTVFAGLWSYRKEQFQDWAQVGAMPKDELLRLVKAIQGYFHSIRYLDCDGKNEVGFSHGGTPAPMVVIGYSRGGLPAKKFCEETAGVDLLILIDPWGGFKDYPDNLAKRVVKIPCPVPFWAFPIWLPAHISLPAKPSTLQIVQKALDELKPLQGGSV